MKYRVVIVVGCALLLLSFLRTAWLSDDAYISFRTADNILNGYGAVWNSSERVQVFTHPLWLAVCTTAFAFTQEVYFTATALSILIALGGAGLIMLRAASWRSAALAAAAMLSSKAFIDYSTSGLENVLTHLLLVAYALQWAEYRNTPRAIVKLALTASLCMLTRLDLAIIVLPPLAVHAWQGGAVRSIPAVVLGFGPLLAWEAWSFFYYGSFVPNTAYAKLGAASIPLLSQWSQGVSYLLRTAVQDPATLPVMLAAGVVSWRERRSDLMLLCGPLAYICYVVYIGGDFMMGRFLSAPFIVSVFVLARYDWQAPQWHRAAAAIVAVGLLSPWEPALLSGYGYSNLRYRWFSQRPQGTDVVPYLHTWSVSDERRFYYEGTGLLKVLGRGSLNHEWYADGWALRAQAPITVERYTVGFTGFAAGPKVHIIDRLALGDPLLARLPASITWKAGHYVRDVPEGYLESVATGANVIADPDLAIYYGALKTSIAGNLWSWYRLKTAAAFQLGRYDVYKMRYLSRLRSRQRVS